MNTKIKYYSKLQADRVKRLFWYILSMIIRPFVKVRKGKVFCWAYLFKQYSCNPKYITEYILENENEKYSIVWAFNKNIDISNIDTMIRIVRTYSLKYLIELYSSQFIITNSRTDLYGDFFLKKKSQFYIQTWHGALGLKKIEKDAESSLSPKYIRRGKQDSKMSDLILSDSDFFSDIVKRAFWWENGDILQEGIPRNDIFFNKTYICELKEKMIKSLCVISPKTKIILYAPTFRDNNSAEVYKLNFANIINEFESKMGCPVILLLRLHPNSLGLINVEELINDHRIINMCNYHDMQELICISDVMISDYSSSMFDFLLINKPCFIYAPDYKEYNRGFYFDIQKLPFPFAATQSKLIDNIKSFNIKDYESELDNFKQSLNISDNGNASAKVVEWMNNHY